jgi:hypothetical protein
MSIQAGYICAQCKHVIGQFDPTRVHTVYNDGRATQLFFHTFCFRVWREEKQNQETRLAQDEFMR